MKFFDFLKNLFSSEKAEDNGKEKADAEFIVDKESPSIKAEVTNRYEDQVDNQQKFLMTKDIVLSSMNWAGLNEPNTSILHMTGNVAQLSANGATAQDFIGANADRVSVLMETHRTDETSGCSAKLGYFADANDELLNGFYADKERVGYYENGEFHNFPVSKPRAPKTAIAPAETMLAVPNSDTYRAEIRYEDEKVLNFDFAYFTAFAMEAGKVKISAVLKSGKEQTIYEAVSTEKKNAVVGGKLVIYTATSGYKVASAVVNGVAEFTTIPEGIETIKVAVDLGGPGQIQGFGIYKFI